MDTAFWLEMEYRATPLEHRNLDLFPQHFDPSVRTLHWASCISIPGSVGRSRVPGING